MGEDMERLITKYHRIGAIDRAKWLEKIDEKIPPSFKERIKKNDKSILNELILPNWVSWDLLRAWALEDEDGVKCDMCQGIATKYTFYNDYTICEKCLKEIKRLKI